jgi:hypothetical protein
LAFPDPDSFYSIRALHHGTVFDVYGEKFDPNTPVLQYGLGGGKHNQQFLFEETSKPGSYRLLARHSGRYLEVAGGSADNDAPLVQGTEETKQEFELRRVGDSERYQLVAAHSGKSLQVKNGSTELGAPIVQSSYDARPHQQFELVYPSVRPHRGSLEAFFKSITDPLTGNEIEDDKTIVQLWFVWNVNGKNDSSYHELTRKKSMTFSVPKGSTHIGYEAKADGEVVARHLGVFRRNMRLNITLYPLHVNHEDLP